MSEEDRLSHAVQLVKAGNYAEAQKIVAEVIWANRHNVRAWILMAKVVDDPEKALQCWQEVARLKPDDPRVQQEIAKLKGEPAPQSEPSQLPPSAVSSRPSSTQPTPLFNPLDAQPTSTDLNQPTAPAKLAHSGLGIVSLVIPLVMIVALCVGTVVIAQMVKNLNPDAAMQSPWGEEGMDFITGYFQTWEYFAYLLIACQVGLPAFSLIGLILGVAALFQKGRRKLYPILGTILNGLLLCGCGTPLLFWLSNTPGSVPTTTPIPLSTTEPITGISNMPSLEEWPTPTTSLAGEPNSEAERQALLALYQAAGGESWADDDGWLSDQPICTWYGITCTDNRVVGISLASNNLKGKLPPEIGQLTNLQELSLGIEFLLDTNYLTELPPEIGELTSLRILDLTSNQLTELPPELWKLTNLQVLYLGRNQLAALPPELWQMTNLQTLGISDLNLSVLPPEIGQLTNLEELQLGRNQLATLPPAIGRLTSLQSLFLEYNQLTELPPEIGQLTNLQTLFLGANKLTALPSEMSRMTSLQSLDLYDNPLSEPPREMCEMLNLSINPPELCDN